MDILPADAGFTVRAAEADFSFDIIGEALPPFDGGRLAGVRPLPPRRKSYPLPSGFSDGDGRKLLLAMEGDRLAGYIALSPGWNGIGVIGDLAVDRGFRRRGVARGLLAEADTWSHAKGLAGLFAETQTNNVDACRFYEACGFVLAGFDRLLYAAIEEHRAETALFWYRLY